MEVFYKNSFSRDPKGSANVIHFARAPLRVAAKQWNIFLRDQTMRGMPLVYIAVCQNIETFDHGSIYMKQRNWLMLAIPILGTCAAGVICYTYLAGTGQADTTTIVGKGKANEPLPIRQVVLFNSG